MFNCYIKQSDSASSEATITRTKKLLIQRNAYVKIQQPPYLSVHPTSAQSSVYKSRS